MLDVSVEALHHVQSLVTHRKSARAMSKKACGDVDGGAIHDQDPRLLCVFHLDLIIIINNQTDRQTQLRRKQVTEQKKIRTPSASRFWRTQTKLTKARKALCMALRVGASKQLFSEGEKNVALFFSFNFNTHLASFHAASRAPYSVSS